MILRGCEKSLLAKLPLPAARAVAELMVEASRARRRGVENLADLNAGARAKDVQIDGRRVACPICFVLAARVGRQLVDLVESGVAFESARAHLRIAKIADDEFAGRRRRERRSLQIHAANPDACGGKAP